MNESLKLGAAQGGLNVRIWVGPAGPVLADQRILARSAAFVAAATRAWR